MDNTSNQPTKSTKFRTKNWVKINYESCRTYNANSKIKFKTSMLRPSLYDYIDGCILVSASITVTKPAAATYPNNKKI